jgi:hypothetical protein
MFATSNVSPFLAHATVVDPDARALIEAFANRFATVENASSTEFAVVVALLGSNVL